MNNRYLKIYKELIQLYPIQRFKYNKPSKTVINLKPMI